MSQENELEALRAKLDTQLALTSKPKPSREPDCHSAEGFCCAGCAQKFWQRFQKLPLELREMVYVRSFEALPDLSIMVDKWANSFRAPVVPPVCYVNKSVLAESLPAILASSDKAIAVKSLRGFHVFCDFLARVPAHGAFKSVQKLHLHEQHIFFSGMGIFQDLTIVCQGLRTLHLDFTASACLHCHTAIIPSALDIEGRNAFVVANPTTYSFRSMQEMTRLLRLRRLFELPVLRSLAIVCSGGVRFAPLLRCTPEAVFAILVSAIRAEADKKLIDIELRFEYSEEKWSDVSCFCRWA